MTTSAKLFPDDPWQLAKARFLAELDPQEQSLYNHATLENLFYTTSNINRDDSETSKIRSAIRKLGPLVSAVENYGKALDIFSSISPLHIAPIWGSIRVVLVLAKTHGKFFDRVVDALERIGDILPRFRDYERIYNKTKHQRLTQALSRAYLEIIVFCTEIRNSIRQQKTSSFRRLIKPLSLDREFEEAVSRFRQHKQNVEEEARTCHMIEAAEERNAQLVLRTAERRAKLLARLSKVDCTVRHKKLVESRHEGTGRWLVVCGAYRQWDSSQGSAVLCCYGIPGSGKSVLASSVVDEVALKQETFFYYCDYADKRTLEPTNIFGTLAYQILNRIDPFPESLATEIEHVEHDGERMLDIAKAASIFKHAIELSSRPIRVVLDGLDEASEKSQKLIFSNFRRLFESTAMSLKLLVTAREELAPSLRINTRVPFFSVQVSVEVIALDIQSYVRTSTRRRIDEGSLVIGDPELEEIIIQALVKGAKGMFLWVEFQLQDLSEQESDHGIKVVLQNLPRSLSETYDRLLAKIEGVERRQYVERMFKWLVVARQPLHVDELREGIAFTLEDEAWEPGKIPTDFKRLVRACGNLVVVNQDSQIVQLGKCFLFTLLFIMQVGHTLMVDLRAVIVFIKDPTEYSARHVHCYITLTTVLHLAHYTVEQYLLQKGANLFHFSKDEANELVVEVCVAYLNFANFDTQIVKFVENPSTDMIALTKIANSGQLLTSDNPGRRIMNVWNTLRPPNTSLSSIDMTKFLPRNQPKQMNITAFSLLPYITTHWLLHSVGITPEKTTLIASTRTQRRDALFTNLILRKQLAFDFRPWPVFDNMEAKDYQATIALLGWALTNNHHYLIEMASRGNATVKPASFILRIWTSLLLTESDFPPLYIEKDSANAWRTSPQSIFSLPKLGSSGLSGSLKLETVPRKIECFSEESGIPDSATLSWLHSKLLLACRKGHLEVIRACFKGCNTASNSILEYLVDHLILEAAAFGQLPVVTYLCKLQGTSAALYIEMGDKFFNALEIATLGCHYSTVIFLQKRGYDSSSLWNSVGSYSRSVKSAIDSGDKQHLEAMLLLGKTGHLPNMAHSSLLSLTKGHDILFHAIRKERHDMLQLLAQYGLNLKNFASHVNPYLLAACAGDPLTCRAFLDQAFVRQYARYTINTVASFSVTKYSVVSLTPTPLFMACFHGNIAVVKSLVTAGADVYSLSPVVTTQISADEDDNPVRTFHSPAVGITGFKDLNTDIPDRPMLRALCAWQYPIIGAVIQGHLEIVQWLVNVKSSPTCIFLTPTFADQTNLDKIDKALWELLEVAGMTAMIESEQHQRRTESALLSQLTKRAIGVTGDELYTLIIAGASVDNLQISGISALRWALLRQNYRLARLVIKHSKNGETVTKDLLQEVLASKTEFPHALPFVLAQTATTLYGTKNHARLPKPSLIRTAWQGKLSLKVALQDTGLNPTSITVDPARTLDNPEYVIQLLECVSKAWCWTESLDRWLDLVDWCYNILQELKQVSEPEFGDTMRHFANLLVNSPCCAGLKNALPFAVVRNGDCFFVHLLKRAGISVNIQDKGGSTPLIHAITHQKGAQMINALLFCEADPQLIDKFGKSALEYALLSDDVDTVETIIKKSKVEINTETSKNCLNWCAAMRLAVKKDNSPSSSKNQSLGEEIILSRAPGRLIRSNSLPVLRQVRSTLSGPD